MEAISSTMPPPPAPSKPGDITVKDLEWSAVMLCQLWMTENQQIHTVTHEYMHQCDAATAVGIIQSLSPAYGKELHRGTVVAKDYTYVHTNIETGEDASTRSISHSIHF